MQSLPGKEALAQEAHTLAGIADTLLALERSIR
jgi:hypothetical protein